MHQSPVHCQDLGAPNWIESPRQPWGDVGTGQVVGLLTEELLDFFGREDSSLGRSGVTPEPTADPISVASPWKHSVQRLMAPK